MGSQPYSPYSYPPYPVRLVRPIFGRQFAGVCVGLARTYNWDVGLVRIVTVLAGVFIFPVAEIAYIACWIGIPEEQLGEMNPPPQHVSPQQAPTQQV